jgi:SAM-dependent methyltransferase
MSPEPEGYARRVEHESLRDLNARAVRSAEKPKKGRWRRVYLAMIRGLAPASVVEFGCGTARLIEAVDAPRRVALDGNPALAALYADTTVDFRALDFDADELPNDLTDFDVAICSDVFEHLVLPRRALAQIRRALKPDGVLLSHVPNKFRFGPTLRVMLGRRKSVNFHEGFHEWNDPHVRRFTDLGYRAFLGEVFRYSVKLTRHGDRLPARWMRGLRVPVPFALEGGPTYASTDDPGVHQRLLDLDAALERGPRRGRDA